MSERSQFKYWLKEEGPSSQLVLASRLRLARNLEGFLFPPVAIPQDRERVVLLVEKAVDLHKKLKHLLRIPINAIPSLDRQVLVETHLISPQYAQGGPGQTFFVEEDGPISIMVNEEDHLRIQCILPGLDLENGWERINEVDDDLESCLDFAYQEQLGFLTTCPTNVGTGLRASTLIHLPALVLGNLLQKVVHAVGQLGIAVRGLYGEGTESQGHFFQLSNQISLGLSEEEITDKVKSITTQVITQELNAREVIKKSHFYQISDRVWRSYGVLAAARVMASNEAMEHLSMVRLGVSMGILPAIPLPALNELMISLKPACIQRMLGEDLDATKRDIMRATIIRQTLRSPLELSVQNKENLHIKKDLQTKDKEDFQTNGDTN